MDATVAAAWIGVVGVALTGGFTFLGAWWGAKQGREQAKEIAKVTADREDAREKSRRLWAERQKAYTAILTSCRAWERLCGQIHEGYNGIQADPHSYDASESCKATKEAANAAYRSMRTSFDENRIILSDEFSARVTEISKKLQQLGTSDLPPLLAASVEDIAVKGRQDLLSIAKNELVY